MFCVFDDNVCDALTFDEVVQGLFSYMYMCDGCGKTGQKEAVTGSPGRIIRAGYLQNIRPPISG
jgi:hypothetical protein